MFGLYTKRYIFKKENHLKIQLIYFTITMLLILADQYIKTVVVKNLKLGESFLILPGVIKATYLKNYGAAFSIMFKQRIFLVLLTIIIIGFIIYYIVDNKITSKRHLLSTSMIVSGGIGNLIDRILRGYVVDYINLIFWPMEDFAVFNFADCLIIFGTVLFAINFIKEELRRKNLKY